MIRLLVILLVLVSAPLRAAEAVTLIPSLAPRQLHVAITSAGWTERQQFLDHAMVLARSWTNSPEWTPYSGAWRISACWAPEATYFSVNGNVVETSAQQWALATFNAGLAAADIHIIVANSMAWAGSTSQRIVITRNPDTAILRHEKFHMLGACADEYTAVYNWANALSARTPNLASSREDALKKWGHLIAAGIIGEPFQDPAGWFRPTAEDCVMRHPHKPACAVCFRAQRDVFFRLIGQPIPPDQPPLSRPVQTIAVVSQ